MKKTGKILLIAAGVISVLYLGVNALALFSDDETTTTETTVTETAVAAETQSAGSEWAEYTSLADAQNVSGINFSFGDTIDGGVYHIKKYAAKSGVIDASYYTESGDDRFQIRQVKLVDGDISGDNNTYSCDVKVDDCGITGIRCRGTEDKLTVCTFNYGDYSYAIYPGSGSYADVFCIIGELTGTTTTLYAKAATAAVTGAAAAVTAPAPNTSAFDEWYAASAEFDDEYYEANDYGWGDLDDEDLEANDYGWGDLDDEDLEANDDGWSDEIYSDDWDYDWDEDEYDDYDYDDYDYDDYDYDYYEDDYDYDWDEEW